MMNTQKTIVWHQLHDESIAERNIRLNKELHRIFFDNKPCNEICPENYLEPTHDIICSMCGARADDARDTKHSTPLFLESLDAMQLIVESGKFAEVMEQFYDWINSGKKYECRIMPYYQKKPYIETSFCAEGNSRQEAFYTTALSAMGYDVIKKEQQ